MVLHEDWQRICPPDENSFVNETLDSLAQALMPSEETWKEPPSLLNGTAGTALFYAYLYSYSHNSLHKELCEYYYKTSINSLYEGILPPTFSNGIAGILWMHEHLKAKGLPLRFFRLDIESIQRQMYECLLEMGSDGDYDTLHGLLGITNYFLESEDSPIKEKAMRTTVEILSDSAIIQASGIYWNEKQIYDSYPSVGVNLGLAHGMPSIIVMLSKMYESLDADRHVLSLANGTYDWLITQELQDSVCMYPGKIYEDGHKQLSRLSWCYGDLGIANSLYLAGKNFRNNLMLEKAQHIAVHCVRNLDPRIYSYEGCLCHGTSGAAHLFNRLYQHTGVSEYRDASLLGFRYLLTHGRHPDAKERTFLKKEYDDNDELIWVPSNSFLNGISGIGLSLIAYVDDTSPDWDRILLLS